MCAPIPQASLMEIRYTYTHTLHTYVYLHKFRGPEI